MVNPLDRLSSARTFLLVESQDSGQVEPISYAYLVHSPCQIGKECPFIRFFTANKRLEDRMFPQNVSHYDLVVASNKRVFI